MTHEGVERGEKQVEEQRVKEGVHKIHKENLTDHQI